MGVRRTKTVDGLKLCTKCGRWLPVDLIHFHRDRYGVDGLKSNCKECCGNQFRIHHVNGALRPPEGFRYCSRCKRLLPDDIVHFFKNRSECKECDNVSFEVHLPNVTLPKKEGYSYCVKCRKLYPLSEIGTNRSYCVACQREIGKVWYKNNRERAIENRSAYERSDIGRHKAKIKRHNRRALKNKNNKLPEITLEQWELCKKHFNNNCAYCGKPTESLHQDHFVSLSKGGDGSVLNIIPCCIHCNSSKCNRDFFDWYKGQRFYAKGREAKILKYLNYKNEVQQLAFL